MDPAHPHIPKWLVMEMAECVPHAYGTLYICLGERRKYSCRTRQCVMQIAVVRVLICGPISPGMRSSSLDKYALKIGSPMPKWLLWAMLHDILVALVAIHECGVMHRDIKPANVLVFTGPEYSRPTAKLADLGIGKVCPQCYDGCFFRPPFTPPPPPWSMATVTQ
jgi:hypothetical protein